MNLYEASNIQTLMSKATFKKTSFSDPHIQRAVNILSKVLNTSPNDIIDAIKSLPDVKHLEISYKAKPLLFKTMHDNLPETGLFELLQKLPIQPEELAKQIGAPIYSNRVTRILLDEMSKTQKGDFFPLRSIYAKKALKYPPITLAHEGKEGSVDRTVKTAAATPDGRFIFNKDFMQCLINFASLVQEKPKAQYFKSNGGNPLTGVKIPDEYCYIEMLIAHELLHYVRSDFHRHKLIKGNKEQEDHTIANWATDFRSNYLLVASGYSQLPMGLFSDHYHLGQQSSYNSYEELYDSLKDEVESTNNQQKQDKNQQDQNQDQQGQDKNQDQQGQQGQGNGQGQDKNQDQQGKDQGNDQNQGKNQPGQDKNDENPTKLSPEEINNIVRDVLNSQEQDDHTIGNKEADPADDPSIDEADLDLHAKRQESKITNPTDDKESQTKTITKKEGLNPEQGKEGSQSKRSTVFDPRAATISWKELLKKCIKSEVGKAITTYSKQSKKSVRTTMSVSQTGMGQMLPGVIKDEPKDIKLMFVIDKSGSMVGGNRTGLTAILNEIKSLLQSQVKDMDFYWSEFDNSATIYLCNYKRNTAKELDYNTKRPGKNVIPFKPFVETMLGGGTVFNITTAKFIESIIQQQYNVILVSDSDIIATENIKSLTYLVSKYPKYMNVVLRDKENFERVTSVFPLIPNNITYFS